MISRLDLVSIGAVHVENRFVDFFEFDGPIETVLDALGVPTAKITFVSEFLGLVKAHSPEGACPHAHATADAVVGIDLNGNCPFIANQCIFLRTGLHTGGFAALLTDIGIVEEILGDDGHFDARLGRVDLTEVVRGAGKLAQPAGCSFFKTKLDKLFHYSSLPTLINFNCMIEQISF